MNHRTWLIPLLLFCALATLRAEDSAPLPEQIATLKAKLQCQTSKHIRALIDADLGKPTRDIGSGLHIPQWDIAGGTLTAHPGTGPTFKAPGGKITWLLETKNPAGSNLLKSYEMTTLPNPANHNNRFWLGNVQFNDGKYNYKSENVSQSQLAKANPNFFHDHSAGTFTLTYAPNINEKTLLESLPERSLVATLQLKGDDAKATIAIYSTLSNRHLEFRTPDDKPLDIQLEKSWDTFFNAP